MKTFKNIILAIVVIAIAFVSCTKDEEEKPDPSPQVLEVNLGNDTTLTYGTSFTLDAGNPGASYLWSTGEITQSITIDTSGTYWVSVEKYGCSDTDTILIDMVYPTIKVETDFGDFRIWLYAQTQLHRQNFLRNRVKIS